MSKFGLTAEGFITKGFSDVKKDIQDLLVNTLGAPINLEYDSLAGEIVALFSKKHADLWQLLEAVYNSQYPGTSEGYSLDGVCAINGLVRLQPTQTRVLCQLTAENGIVVPNDTKVGIDGSTVDFIVEGNDIEINNNNCNAIKVRIINVLEDEYIISINNIVATYTPPPEEEVSVETIVIGLIDAIDGLNLPDIFVHNDNNQIVVEGENIGFSCVISAGLEIVDITCSAWFVCTQRGKVSAPSNAIRVIRTPVEGLISVNNINAGTEGRDLETDIELRARRDASLKLGGAGTIEAIKSRVLNVPGVTSVTMFENKTNEVVDGRPPHSFETLVLGGDNNSVALTIWNSKPAGIEPFGNTTATIKDSWNRDQVVGFSRATNMYVYVTINLTVLDGDLFTDSVKNTIKNNIVKNINSIGVGKNVIYQSLFKDIFIVSGITNAVITIGGTLTENNVPALSSQNITISSSQIAITDSGKITINVA